MIKIKALSWNIWIDGHFNEIAEFLKKSDADIIGLQEVKNDDPSLDVIKYLNGLGYEHVFAPVKYAWDNKTFVFGPAIFSKHEIVSSETYNLHEIDKRVALRADVHIGDSILHVFSTHLSHSHQKQSKVQEQQAEALLKIVPKERAIVMGDFNATPESNTVRKIAKVFTDADTQSLPTWSVYPEGCEACNPQKIDTRLDYIFVTPDLKVNTFEVGKSMGSDHLPIIATIDL